MNSLKDHPLMDERPDMLEPEDWVDLCELILAFESLSRGPRRQRLDREAPYPVDEWGAL